MICKYFPPFCRLPFILFKFDENEAILIVANTKIYEMVYTSNIRHTSK